jgi:hypothetical protein
MNRVIIAVNVHPDYLFLAPLTAILWATRTGYRPTIFTSHETPSLTFLKRSGLCDLNVVNPQNDRMAIKLLRWYCYPFFNPDDALLLADVDCWPINGAFWDRPVTKPITCFYGDAYQGKRHATHGFRASVTAFRKICPVPDDPMRYMVAPLCPGSSRVAELRKLPEDDERRWSDDASQAELVLKWMAEHPNDYELVERGPSPPDNRIDRSDWPSTFAMLDFIGKADAHLPRDASDRRVWRMIYPLFEKLAPDWAGWARSYRDEWERSYS